MRTSRWLLLFYVGIILFGVATALPNIFSQSQLDAWPNWLPKQKITLGLDLRGGSHLVLEVDAQALIRERLESLTDQARRSLKDADIRPLSVRKRENIVVVTLKDPSQRPAAIKKLGELAAAITTMSLQGTISDINIVPVGDADIRISLTKEGVNDRIDAATEQSLEIIRTRIDEIGVAEPTIQRVGPDRILVQLPGVQDPARIREILGSTAKLTFHMLREPEPGGQVAVGAMMLPGTKPGESYSVERRISLSGERLNDARPGFNQQTGEPVVTFRLDSVGARIFGTITQNNVGRPFAIVLDDKVLSAPVIREPILGGSGEISGDFTVQEAADLSALLRAGALPAELTVIEERTVGADLGEDAIKRGFYTGLIGLGLVFAFIFLLYGRWGLVSNFALALNVVLTLGALSILGATLTLPGIAGMVLGIGLAVDANVLINERIREETRQGRGALGALDFGFKKAFATIVDSNVTALIATMLLFMFGSGPVRGFAVTMGFSIAISMFTAVSIVRVIMTGLVRRLNLKTLQIEPPFGIKLVPEGTQIQFMKARFFGLGVSAFLSIASVILFFYPGLNYGVDFKGGIQMELVTEGPADLGKLRSVLEGLNTGEVALQQFGKDSNVLVRLEEQKGGDKAQSEAVGKVRAALAKADPSLRIERTEVVGPKISGELAKAGILSVVLASIAMLIYIWVRFEWPFAVGAIATLILDVTKTVGFFALTQLDFNLTAIAALLTLIGYSVNDKVVVYDRMRENMRKYKKMPFREIIDRSINETLARSLYTSVTAFLALLPMAIWGGSAVSSFAIPMVFGIAVAASSSVFIAAPILLFLGDWRKSRRTATAQTADASS